MAIFQEDEEVQFAKCGDNVRIRLKNAEEEVSQTFFFYETNKNDA